VSSSPVRKAPCAADRRVLVVEDERAQRDALGQYLGRMAYKVTAVASGEEASRHLADASYDALITDLRLPGMDGLTLIRRARELNEEMSVLLITAYASVESAIEALRIGAQDYLLKPLILEEVGRKLGWLLEHRALLRENARLRQVLQQRAVPTEIVAGSPSMREVVAWIPRAAATRSTVLITGETGTGKEVVARAIHDGGPGRDQPFLAVNLAAVHESTAESELFGHERGAFTGAERRREGLLRAAGGGTVFLDEIAELSLGIQAKLLRALEAREVQPLGSDVAAPFDARIIAATHRDPDALVSEGRFRQDLYYRLNVVHIHLPPLRDRPEDIPALVRHLVGRHASRVGLPAPVVAADAVRALCQHPWRGNIRELSNVLERALILADEGRIDVDDLPSDVRERPASLTLDDAVARFEAAHIAMVLKLCDGSREKAAAAMGISEPTLYRRLERLGLKGFEVRRGRGTLDA
jgi:DNA-binding NtrC family response regulator